MKKLAIIVTAISIIHLATVGNVHAMNPCQFVHDEYMLSLRPTLTLQQCMIPEDGSIINFMAARDIPLITLSIAGAYLAFVILAKITPRNAY